MSRNSVEILLSSELVNSQVLFLCLKYFTVSGSTFPQLFRDCFCCGHMAQPLVWRDIIVVVVAGVVVWVDRNVRLDEQVHLERQEWFRPPETRPLWDPVWVDHVVASHVRGGAREGGVIVDVVIAGAGPRLVLVHGSPLHRPLWRPVHGIVGDGSLLARSVGEVGGLEI